MNLSIRTFSQYVRDMAAAVQSASSQILDLSVGSVLRAILEANASVALWLQMLISDVMEASRAATARGNSLDSWMADFSLSRLAATSAVGSATFSRFSSLGSSLVPAGTKVRTADGSVTFIVVEDQGHVHWDAEQVGYLVSPGQTALEVPIRAEVAGTGGNVRAGAITLLASSVAGIDAVANQQVTLGGVAAESDESCRGRFISYVNSRSKATTAAIAFEVASIQQGTVFAIHENQDAEGNPRTGHSVVTIDDGTGAPPAPLLSLVAEAIDRVRPIGSTFSVHPPTIVFADIVLSVAIPGVSPSSANRVRDAVSDAIAHYVNGLGIQTTLSATRIAQVAYSASTHIKNVSNIRINGGLDDLVPGPREVIKSNTIAVT